DAASASLEVCHRPFDDTSESEEFSRHRGTCGRAQSGRRPAQGPAWCVAGPVGRRTRVDVGTGFSDAERENPPPIGSIITFRYQELSDAGVPRFPSYIGMREDVELSAPPPPPTPPKATTRKPKAANT